MLKRLLGFLAPIGAVGGAILVWLGFKKQQDLKREALSTAIDHVTGTVPSGHGLKACFVSQRNYPSDQRLYTAMTALQDVGWEVHLICTRDNNRPAESVEDGVHIHRIPSIERTRGSKLRYIAEYISFLLPAFYYVTKLHMQIGFHLVEVTNLPDPLLLSALVPRLTGAKIIFDVRECSPEMFNDRLGLSLEGRPMKFIIAIEQFMVRFAHATITCTEQMKHAMVKRGANPSKIFVTLNSGAAYSPSAILPDAADTSAATELRIVTHGTIIKRYGHQVMIKAMPYVLEKIPNAHLTIYGKGALRPELEQMVADMKLGDSVTFGGFVPDEELVGKLRQGHIGIVTLVRNPEADLVHTYKMFEYLSLGIPIVISRTSAAEAYFTDDEMCFFEAGNEHDLARALLELANDPQRRHDMAVNGLKAYERYSPDKQKQATLDIANSLMKQ
ncbi:MAG: glycosyltransferase family 4 protein [Anaerolineae bacterium]|nr:glycosyltransferase family 4 protein [Anaerolineae bacterium]